MEERQAIVQAYLLNVTAEAIGRGEAPTKRARHLGEVGGHVASDVSEDVVEVLSVHRHALDSSEECHAVQVLDGVHGLVVQTAPEMTQGGEDVGGEVRAVVDHHVEGAMSSTNRGEECWITLASYLNDSAEVRSGEPRTPLVDVDARVPQLPIEELCPDVDGAPALDADLKHIDLTPLRQDSRPQRGEVVVVSPGVLEIVVEALAVAVVMVNLLKAPQSGRSRESSRWVRGTILEDESQPGAEEQPDDGPGGQEQSDPRGGMGSVVEGSGEKWRHV